MPTDVLSSQFTSATLKAAVLVTVLSVATALGALSYSKTVTLPPIHSLTLHTTAVALKAGDAIPVTIGGCVEGDKGVPLVILTVFSQTKGTEALMGAGAAVVAEPGCRNVETQLFVPVRATPGEWKVILLTFTPDTDVQTRVVVSEPFMVVQ